MKLNDAKVLPSNDTLIFHEAKFIEVPNSDQVSDVTGLGSGGDDEHGCADREDVAVWNCW